MSFRHHHTSFSQTVIRDHFSSTATYSLIVHQLPLMNERPGNFTHSFQPLAQCQYKWLPPAGGYSICHFSLSSFVVLLLPSSLTCHVWCLHIAGGFLFQLRQSPVCGTLSVCWIECDSNNATLFLPLLLAVGKFPPLLPPPHQNKVKCQGLPENITLELAGIQAIFLLALPPCWLECWKNNSLLSFCVL